MWGSCFLFDRHSSLKCAIRWHHPWWCMWLWWHSWWCILLRWCPRACLLLHMRWWRSPHIIVLLLHLAPWFGSVTCKHMFLKVFVPIAHHTASMTLQLTARGGAGCCQTDILWCRVWWKLLLVTLQMLREHDRRIEHNVTCATPKLLSRRARLVKIFRRQGNQGSRLLDVLAEVTLQLIGGFELLITEITLQLIGLCVWHHVVLEICSWSEHTATCLTHERVWTLKIKIS